jgi:hypothetical protein
MSIRKSFMNLKSKVKKESCRWVKTHVEFWSFYVVALVIAADLVAEAIINSVLSTES